MLAIKENSGLGGPDGRTRETKIGNKAGAFQECRHYITASGQIRLNRKTERRNERRADYVETGRDLKEREG